MSNGVTNTTEDVAEPRNIDSIVVTAEVANPDGSLIVVIPVKTNMELISVTEDVLKPAGNVNDVKALVSPNMPFISVTFDVLKVDGKVSDANKFVL